MSEILETLIEIIVDVFELVCELVALKAKRLFKKKK